MDFNNLTSFEARLISTIREEIARTRARCDEIYSSKGMGDAIEWIATMTVNQSLTRIFNRIIGE